MNKGIVILIVIIIFVFVYFYLIPNRDSFTNTGFKKFTTPPSFTKLKDIKSNEITKLNNSGGNLLEKYADKLRSLANIVITVGDVNILQIPGFFNCNEKWKGCLPRPLYQGTCGSCWGFASVTCLSARFYIESCGNGGCDKYPQINVGSLDGTIRNLNYEYSFRKDYLENMVKDIDSDKSGLITKEEWSSSAEKFRKQMVDTTKDSHYRHMMAQILVYMLDFQSLGSLDIKDSNKVKNRADATFRIWKNRKDHIDIKKLIFSWRIQPINLSAEKLIACCTDCMKQDFKVGNTLNNPVCGGGSLQDAWTLLRDTGTSTSLCIGYNLDDYKEGDKLSSCSEIQGPYYSFCSGYKLDEYKNRNLKESVDELESSNIYPLAIPKGSKVPWTDPQLFRFRAKNAYYIDNDVSEIQREIMERGPVNSGIRVYKDFQESFGGSGLGGQKYKSGDPLGGSDKKLIYMKDPKTKEQPIGGHAITIVGWGNFKYMKGNIEYEIPYWTCLNSWGVEWGHSGFPSYNNRNSKPENMKFGGYFWIVRGINNCGIEENVTCGQPNLENMSYPGVIERYGWGLPSPSMSNRKVHYLPVLNTTDKTTKNNATLHILPAEEGGGTYVNYTPGCKENDPGQWQIKSMEGPSPYLMFWPDRRPVFHIGYTLNKLSSNDDIIILQKDSIEKLALIMTVSYNPILLIGDSEKQEQVQVLNIKGDKVKVNRAVNFNDALPHEIGSKVKIFPYEELSVKFLEKNGFKNA